MVDLAGGPLIPPPRLFHSVQTMGSPFWRPEIHATPVATRTSSRIKTQVGSDSVAAEWVNARVNNRESAARTRCHCRPLDAAALQAGHVIPAVFGYAVDRDVLTLTASIGD